MRLVLHAAILSCLFTLEFAPLHGAELNSRRIDIHVDGKRPIAGERSRFAVSPQGHIFFTYTLAAGEFECKPLGVIEPAGTIRMSAIDSESTWNVEGWATYGFPFDLVVDAAGELHVAARHRGQPYGVDYWRRVDGVWRLESFGADVTYGGNNVSLGLLPGGRPVVVCLDRNRIRLTVWERSDAGRWLATRPDELADVASGQFDLEVHKDGTLRVVFCSTNGSPVCATRDVKHQWAREPIAATPVARMIASTLDNADRLHVSFAAGARGDCVQNLHLATLTTDGKWQNNVVSKSDKQRHVGRTDIAAAAGRVAIAWEQGVGPQFTPKDYGGKVGSVMLTVIDKGEPATHELVAKNGGRPSLALAPDGKTAWVGVYTGNDNGDDFYLLNCRLDGGQPTPARIVNGKPASIFRHGCLKDIDSGNEKAERRGLQRIDLSGLSAVHRQSLIERFLNHDDPLIRVSMARELARSADSVAHFADRLPKVLDDPDRLVRKTFLEGLATSTADRQFLKPVLKKAIASDDAMTRLAAAEVLRQHPDWVDPDVLTMAVKKLGSSLNSDNLTAAGSASLAFERMIDVDGVLAQLNVLVKTGSPLQRVRATLILFRTGQAIDLSELNEVPKQGNEQAQLALCGLLGQLRTAECVPLLEQTLVSQYPAARASAVFALRSIAHVAELKPVAKHPRGFDLLALRVVEPTSAEKSKTRAAAVDALIESLKHADPNVRQKACDALNRVRAKQAVASIKSLLDDPDSGVRISARTALGILNDAPLSDVVIDHKKWKRASVERSARRLGKVHRAPTAVVDGVVQVGSDKQLLIDDFVIEKMTGLTRRLHPFKKHPRNPVFQAQVPWEEGWADPFMSTVIYDRDERCFKMWYRCGPRHSLKGYAVSSDGIHWERPDIAQSAWQQFPNHNLLGFDGRIATWQKPGNNVQFFPDASGTDRFLSLFYQPANGDYAVSRSADGTVWQPPQSVRPAHGDVVSLIWDPSRQEYLFFPKYKRQHDGHVRRSFAATTLKSIDGPFSATFPFLAGHRDDERVGDDACRAYGSLLKDTLRLRDFHSEIYSVTAIPYEGVVVALYDLWAVTGSAEGPLDMPMKVSRDMKTWHDVDYPRRALSIGRFGEWDSGMVYGGNTMLVVDDQIRLYYLGANMGHCTRVLPMTKPYHALGVGLATLRLDGFASLRSGEKPGQLTTKPLRVAGNRLQINASCLKGGSIKIALLDTAGKPLPGFAAENCDPFVGDSPNHTVTWDGKAEIRIPRDAPIRLRIEVQHADLFAFQF